LNGTDGKEVNMRKSTPSASDLTTILVEVPLADAPPAAWSLHINTHLTPTQSHVLRRLTLALDRRLARLANNRRVVNASDALKYLLEAIDTRDLPSDHP
jgi:hypothetical protein